MAGLVLGPNVFLHILPLLVGRFLFQSAAGPEVDTLLEEIFVGESIFGTQADMKPVDGKGKEKAYREETEKHWTAS